MIPEIAVAIAMAAVLAGWAHAEHRYRAAEARAAALHSATISAAIELGRMRALHDEGWRILAGYLQASGRSTAVRDAEVLARIDAEFQRSSAATAAHLGV